METSRLLRINEYFSEAECRSSVFSIEIELKQGIATGKAYEYRGWMGWYIKTSETTINYGLSPNLENEIRQKIQLGE